ncbi:MAG: FAD-dependent oxidoreductase [Actinomycetota bacterium]|nr:FAD-dependent oxidoreductase [Actinomycetota bacterium]
MNELRASNLDRIDGHDFDVLVVGGGINGAVVAAALASRGADVALVERGDFAGATSQETSNLVWGGITYLGNYELRLVRKLCRSRNRLMAAYPANIREIRFLAALGATAPYPRWLAGAGTVAYWGIGGFRTASPRVLSTRSLGRREPLVNLSGVRGAIEYADAYLADNDARFVFGFVRSALDLGAAAVNYVELTGAERAAGRWRVALRDHDAGRSLTCGARVIVNAAGPFVGALNDSLGARAAHRIVHSKGIHLVVDRLVPDERVLAFFDDTRRLFYVIPMGCRSVIGTTDTRVDDPDVHVTDDDRDFLLEQINARLDLPAPLGPADVIAERCGTRPLVVPTGGGDERDAEWTSLSRRHEIDVDADHGVVTIFGGKLTDCLNVGEAAAAAVGELGVGLAADDGSWFGEPSVETHRTFVRQAQGLRLDELRRRAGQEPLSTRLWRRYGRRAFEMLDAVREDRSMSEDVMGSAGHVRVELHHTARNEMVVRLDDFLRRRSTIAQVVRDEDIRGSGGLAEVAEVLFGADASARLREHYGPDFVAAGVGEEPLGTA